jgi:hypothetical protein
MKQLVLLVALLAVSPSMAADAPKPQSIQDVTEQANDIIAAVRAQRDANADALAQAQAMVAKLQREAQASRRGGAPAK